MIPAMRATSRASPLSSERVVTRSRVSGDIATRPAATASLAVTSLAVPSTIRAWDSGGSATIHHLTQELTERLAEVVTTKCELDGRLEVIELLTDIEYRTAMNVRVDGIL